MSEMPPERENLILEVSLEQWWEHACGDALTDDWDPELGVPPNRYGRTNGEVAWWAVGGLYAYDATAGVENETEGIILLEDLMRLACDDRSDLALLLDQCWHSMPPTLQNRLGGECAVVERMAV